jgi:endonuclease/exonuclease/phosphatase family metal-dependent hydrolase
MTQKQISLPAMRCTSFTGLILLVLFLVTGAKELHAEPLRVVSYNAENLFHPKHDSVMIDSTIIEKDDWEWTPDGERHWSYTRYYRKVENIARVLTNIGEWDGVDIVGLQEVENALCVKRLCRTLRNGEYDFVHYESPDPRGIDVAMIYKKARVDTINSRAIGVQNTDRCADRLQTRDILYVCARVDKKDTLHLFVCHLPSQRGGAAESEWKRTEAKRVLQSAIDSVYAVHPKAKIIVMGDFNGTPKDDLKGVKNRMMKMPAGTHKYQGRWTCLDQFYTSPALDSLSSVSIYDAEWVQEPDEKYLGLRPIRTFNGFHYQKDGFSDHLPIVLITSL